MGNRGMDILMNLPLDDVPPACLCNIGAWTITYTILVAPHYNYGIMGPKTLFQLLRPKWEASEFGASDRKRKMDASDKALKC